MSGRMAVWTLWGLVVLVVDLGSIAVIGLQPVDDQHAVVGSAMVLLPVLAAAAMWSMRVVSVPRAALLTVVMIGALFLTSWVQSLLGEAFLYGNGGHALAPVLLAAAVVAGVLWAFLGGPWLPQALGIVSLLALYVFASFEWSSATDRAMLLGGAAIGTIALLVFCGIGAIVEAMQRRPEAVPDVLVGGEEASGQIA